MTSNFFKVSILPLALFFVFACSGIPVVGVVSEQRISTRVDSEAARYLIADYLAGKGQGDALHARIDALYRDRDQNVSRRELLNLLSEEFSVDFAAAYFADRIGRNADNRRFREIYQEYRRAFAKGRTKLPAGIDGYEVIFVPTYLYKRLPLTGSDFAVPKKAMEKIGMPFQFIETVEDGSVETNAEIVARAIAERQRGGRRLILISASKSGPEVAMALTRLGDARTSHVAGWVNAVGALQGTPLADGRALADVEDLVGSVNPAGRESLMTERSRRRFDDFRVPEHILIVNYFGVPFSGDVSSWARRGFDLLSKYGPNDGILLLADMVFPRGATVVELGLDHFLLDGNIDAATVGLVSALIHLENVSAANGLPAASRKGQGALPANYSTEGQRD